MKKQLQINIGSTAGRGKTSTAIEMFAPQMLKPGMQLFFISDENEAVYIYSRLLDIIGKSAEIMSPGKLMSTTSEIDANELLDNLCSELEKIDESRHVYIVLDLMTIDVGEKRRYLDYIRGMLHNNAYTIVTTTQLLNLPHLK